MDKDLLAEIQQEDESPFDNILAEMDQQETETSEESPTETKQTEESPSQEGEEDKSNSDDNPVDASEDADKSKETPDENKDIPFHMHPRWKEKDEKIARLEKALEEQTNSMGEMKTGIDDIRQNLASKEPSEQYQVFKELFDNGSLGDDQLNQAWEKFQKLVPQQSVNVDELKQSLRQELAKEQEEKKSQEQALIEWSRQQIQELKDEGKTFDENKLLKVIEKYSPTNGQGHTDFNKAYELLKLEEKALQDNSKLKAKKQIASRSSSDSSAEPKKDDFVTPADLEGKDWTEFIN